MRRIGQARSDEWVQRADVGCVSLHHHVVFVRVVDRAPTQSLPPLQVVVVVWGYLARLAIRGPELRHRLLPLALAHSLDELRPKLVLLMRWHLPRGLGLPGPDILVVAAVQV